ncbi:nucleotide-diphospho-sugar transferase [uncultured Flavobacterium sp.]|uniref:nucleotide-diphospho-sugar transferase n=1 Tax=uncultured Flavobacterium sp. TaxID=165435 RepID=UPI0030EB66DA|tara:strand:- start:79003 stop:79929 length:927 start_codon:yes stop_codon:yes gene_type:complete
MKETCKAPVLLIAFNRPDTTKRAFESIRKVKPTKLYIAVDGPRAGKQGESELCKQVVEITKQVDWECETKYLIREQNVGCKYGVSGAISWALESEESVIIIEDDIVPVSSFFYFAEELLEKYKNDERIAMVSGNNYTPIDTMEFDYTFSKYGHIWGWATWKRVWDKFDVEIPDINEEIKSNLSSMNFIDKKEKQYYIRYFKKLATKITEKTENTWDSQFGFFRNQNNLLSIVPKFNLCSNIGETSSRTNTVASSEDFYYPANDSFVLEKHPNNVALNLEYDKYHFNKHIDSKSFLEKVIYKINKKLKN